MGLRNIYVAGSFAGQDGWNDLLSRLAWYFTPYLDQIGSITLCASAAQVAAARPAGPVDPRIGGLLEALKAKIQVTGEDRLKERLASVDPERHLFLLADDSLQEDYRAVIGRFRSKGRFYRVDPERVRMEGSFYLWSGLNTFSDPASETAGFQARFREMAKELGTFDKAYVFGTGPSLSGFTESHDFSDGLTIIANSIVLNREMLDRLRPRIIVAADPIFHAGCSSYAAAFRAELARAMERTGAWFLCPLRDVKIYQTYLPDHLQARILGIPFDSDGAPPVDLGQTYALKPYPNILTLMLLPLAATFARSVHIAGCDGRRLTENNAFWSHDKKAQFNDEMENIKKVHPGFFAIDYNNYYFDHARDLETVLKALEDAGRTVVSETPSFVPALYSRERAGLRPQTGAQSGEFSPGAMAILDPDAKGEWGHFLAYDRRLGLSAVAAGLSFSIIGRTDLAASARPPWAEALLRVFSRHSWTLGNKWPQTQTEDLTAFAFEAEEALQQLEASHPGEDILLFMYCGSVEAADVLEHVLIAHPRVRAVINLFWSYNFDTSDPRYEAHWRPLVSRLARGRGQVRIMHSTPQIAAEFEQAWGVRIPVLPHPSTTFSDKDARELAAQPVRRLPAGRKPRILFPGGARREKGYYLAVEACAELAAERAYDLRLRTRLDGAEPAMRRAVDALPAEVVRDGEDYGEEDFVSWLSSADVLVVPYLPEAFSNRTSGMLVDAMLLGIPVVVVRETWLADELALSGAGAAVEPDAGAIAAGIREVLADYPARAAATRKAADHYLKGSLWSGLTSRVLEAADSSRLELPRPGFLCCLTGAGKAGAAGAIPKTLAPEEAAVICYDEPVSVMAWELQAGKDWPQIRADWMVQARQALDLFRQARRQVLLLRRPAGRPGPGALPGIFENAGLPAGWQRGTAPADPLLAAIAKGFLEQDPHCRALLEELAACTVPDAGAGPEEDAGGPQAALQTYQALTAARRAYGDLRQDEMKSAHRASGLERALQEQAGARRLLEEQLKQLQAVTEQHFRQLTERTGELDQLRQELAQLRGARDGLAAERDGLQDALEQLRAELEQTRGERDQARGELDHIFSSKSWRVTEPLRQARRVLDPRAAVASHD